MGQLSQRPLCSKCASGPIFAISHVGLSLSPILRALTNDCDCALFGAVRWVDYLFWESFWLPKETSQLAFNQSRRLLVSNCRFAKEARPLCEHKTSHLRKGVKISLYSSLLVDSQNLVYQLKLQLI